MEVPVVPIDQPPPPICQLNRHYDIMVFDKNHNLVFCYESIYVIDDTTAPQRKRESRHRHIPLLQFFHF